MNINKTILKIQKKKIIIIIEMDYDPNERQLEKNEENSFNSKPNIPENIPNPPIIEETNRETAVLIPQINEEKKEMIDDKNKHTIEDHQLFNINLQDNIDFDDKKTEMKNFEEVTNDEAKHHIFEEHHEKLPQFESQQSPFKLDNNSPALKTNPILEESKQQNNDFDDLVPQIIDELIHKITNSVDQNQNLQITPEINNPNAIQSHSLENRLMDSTSEIQNPININDLPNNPLLPHDFEEEDKKEEEPHIIKTPIISKEKHHKKYPHRSLSLPDLTSLSDIEGDLPKSISVQDFSHQDSTPQINNPKNKNNPNFRNSINDDEETKGDMPENNQNNQPRFVYGHALEDIVYNVNNLRGQLNLLKRVTENAGIDATYLQNIDQSFSMALNGIRQTVNERLLNNNPNSEMSEAMLIQMLRELQGDREAEESKGGDNERAVGSRWENSNFYRYWRNFRGFMEFLFVNTKCLGTKVYTVLKNPENLFKLLVLMIAIVFYSGIRQIPKLEKYDGELFDWLAYNKSSRMLLFVIFFFHFQQFIFFF